MSTTPAPARRSRDLRMSAEHSLLVLVDFQERLMPAMHDGEAASACLNA